MKESLKILQNIEQANEPANLDFLDSLDITKTANHLSNLVQPCIKEIIEVASKVKNSVEIGLKKLNELENLSPNNQNLKELTALQAKLC